MIANFFAQVYPVIFPIPPCNIQTEYQNHQCSLIHVNRSSCKTRKEKRKKKNWFLFELRHGYGFFHFSLSLSRSNKQPRITIHHIIVCLSFCFCFCLVSFTKRRIVWRLLFEERKMRKFLFLFIVLFSFVSFWILTSLSRLFVCLFVCLNFSLSFWLFVFSFWGLFVWVVCCRSTLSRRTIWAWGLLFWFCLFVCLF